LDPAKWKMLQGVLSGARHSGQVVQLSRRYLDSFRRGRRQDGPQLLFQRLAE
jgi:hypothetical protein